MTAEVVLSACVALYVLGSPGQFDVAVTVAFTAAFGLLAALDLDTESEGTVDPGITLVAPALLLLDPLSAVLSVAGGRLLGVALGSGFRQPVQLLPDALQRVSVAGAGLLVLVASGMVGVAESLVIPAVVVCTTLADFLLQQVAWSAVTKRPLLMLARTSVGVRGWLNAAQFCLGLLTVLTYQIIGAWALIPIVLMLLVMRQSYAMLLQVRAAHASIVDTLARAFRAQKTGADGDSADTLPMLAKEVGRRTGVFGRDLERLSYAALFFGLDVTAGEADAPLGVSRIDVLADVHFLQGVQPVLRLLAFPELATDGETYTRRDVCLAYIVASTHARIRGTGDVPVALGRCVPAPFAEKVGQAIKDVAEASSDKLVRTA